MKELLPWQQRVLNERDELLDKIHKLRLFFFDEKFSALHQFQQTLLHDQYKAMSKYCDILSWRIDLFEND
jgi:hypothetical protein